MAEKEKKDEKEGQEFDFDLGKVKFGGIFKGISDLISLADKVKGYLKRQKVFMVLA
jgi:HSP20 family protein